MFRRHCRVARLRKRAQSAADERSLSLQHLTLSEFLKEYVTNLATRAATHAAVVQQI